MTRVLTALLLTLFLTACGSKINSPAVPSTPKIASTAAIWFHPDPLQPGNPNWGSADLLQLFQPNAPWPTALAHTQVVGFYAGWLASIDDPSLQQVVTFLDAHNLTMEIEAPSLQGTATCGSGIEGFVSYPLTVPAFTAAYLNRLAALHAHVAYIKVDEPFYFGAIAPDPRSCHLTSTEIATEVAAYATLVHASFPNTEVGDVEPVFADGGYPVDTATALGQWHQVYQSVSGANFPFFFADIDWSNSGWPQLVKTLELQSKQQGLKFGIIYIGDLLDTTAQEWTTKAANRFQLYQGDGGGNPDFVLFQSWEAQPQHCLPETDPTTFTGLLDAYIQATT